jgi:hypothetical protein
MIKTFSKNCLKDLKVNIVEDLIMKALKKKKSFIGMHMLCRYLNGLGYQRYGCNVQYTPPYKGKDKINPCPILCPGTDLSLQKIRYWVNKLAEKGKLFTKTTHYPDSKNPNSSVEAKQLDVFRFVCQTKKVYDQFFSPGNDQFFSIYPKSNNKGGELE